MRQAAPTNLYALINRSIELFSGAKLQSTDEMISIQFNKIWTQTWHRMTWWHDSNTFNIGAVNKWTEAAATIFGTKTQFVYNFSFINRERFFYYFDFLRNSQTSPLTIACDLNYFCMTIWDDIRPRAVSLSFSHSLLFFILLSNLI